MPISRDSITMNNSTRVKLATFVESEVGKHLLALIQQKTHQYPNTVFSYDNVEWRKAYTEMWSPLWHEHNLKVRPFYDNFRNCFFSIVETIERGDELSDEVIGEFRNALLELKDVHLEEAETYGFSVDDRITRELRGTPHEWFEMLY